MNIFVSNINFRTQQESLEKLFSNYGDVESAHIITDRETGRSRGFGFVEMPNDDEANAAIEALNGKEFEEKELNVSQARPREERGPRANFGGPRGYGRGPRGGYGRDTRGGYGRDNRRSYGEGHGGYGHDARGRYDGNDGYGREDRY